MPKYRLSVDFEGPETLRPLSWVTLPDGSQAWLSTQQFAKYITRLDVAPPPAPPAPPPPGPRGALGLVFVGKEPPGRYIAARAAGATWALLRVICEESTVPAQASGWWAWPDAMIANAEAPALLGAGVGRVSVARHARAPG